MWNLYGVNMVLKQMFFQHRRRVCQIDFIEGIKSLRKSARRRLSKGSCGRFQLIQVAAHMRIVVAVDPGTSGKDFPPDGLSGRMPLRALGMGPFSGGPSSLQMAPSLMEAASTATRASFIGW